METKKASSMLATMAAMQEEHNIQVHQNWREEGYEYYRAIWVECAEMLDHFGWKWWKKQSPDMDQVKLELVDIWHFALSELIRSESLKEGLAVRLANIRAAEPDPELFRRAIESLAASSLNSRSFEMDCFLDAMRSLPMELDELFELYIGKNILNRFRQNHGYKEGTYRKEWSGREDNEHLIEALDTLRVEPDQLPNVLYQELERRYAEAS
ncbi:dUTP diphosphatase [Gammaproteobacteria bacterium]|nr:dUTP diphosphatase [Gammaproteobacteria bacterium]